MQEKWIYKNDNNNEVRYLLGENNGNNPLICFGINPSFAVPNCLDPTMRIVKGFAQNNHFGGWIMLNIYPQRATNPDNLDLEINSEIHEKNITEIGKILKKYPKSTIWAAWGNLIKKRSYLSSCLIDIIEQNNETTQNWVIRGELTVLNNPHHPLGLKRNALPSHFNISDYCNNLKPSKK